VRNNRATRTKREENDMTAEAEKKTWDQAVLDKYQAILDKSKATATPVVGGTFGRDDWRFDAETFLNTWNDTRMCTVASASAEGHPHMAVIHANFDDQGVLSMRMLDGAVREKDFAANPRVALGKHTQDGAVMTVYGKPRVIPDSFKGPMGGDGSGPGSNRVEIDVTRIYAMKPRR
jgi:hypothetical protein